MDNDGAAMHIAANANSVEEPQYPDWVTECTLYNIASQICLDIKQAEDGSSYMESSEALPEASSEGSSG